MGWFDRRRQAAVSVAVLALTSGMLVSSATAEPPSEEEIAAAREAEGRTASSIADLEVELASLATRLEDATVRAQQANEEYLGAQEALDEATARADEAREAAATAQAEVEEQRAEIGRIAMSAYRSGPGALGPIEPLLSADSFENAMQRATTTERMGTRADEALQRFEATELVAATFQRRADEAAAAQEDATTALAAAAEEARDAASGAETQLALSADRREGLIAQLASQRGTTAELERERQDAQDEERRRREAEVARAAALEAAREQEAASRANDRPTAPAQPAPAPSRPDGEPSRPAPEPARPAPSRPGPSHAARARAHAPRPQPTTPRRPSRNRAGAGTPAAAVVVERCAGRAGLGPHAAGQALRVGRGRTQRLRLLGPHPDGLRPRRDLAAAHDEGAVRRHHARAGRPAPGRRPHLLLEQRRGLWDLPRGDLRRWWDAPARAVAGQDRRARPDVLAQRPALRRAGLSYSA